MQFQVLFHSPNRGSFHLSLTVLVHYRSLKSIWKRVVPLYSSRISRVPLYSRNLSNITHTGLSPSLVSFSKLFKFLKQIYWPIPFSLATTNGSIDFFSSSYLDVSVLRVISLNLCIQFKVTHKVLGFHSEIYGSKLAYSSP